MYIHKHKQITQNVHQANNMNKQDILNHRLPDGVGTNRVVTEGPHTSYMFGLSAHMLPHVAILCHMLPAFPLENRLGGIVALL